MTEEIEPIKKKVRLGDSMRLDFSKLTQKEIEEISKMDDIFLEKMYSGIEEIRCAFKAVIDNEKEEQK
jgi:hypothetical protein